MKRVVAVAEAFEYDAVAGVANMQGFNGSTAIDPGGRRLSATANVTFELE